MPLLPLFGFWSKGLIIDIPTGLSSSSTGTTITANASTFSTTPAGGDTHYSSQWLLATDSGFSNVIRDSSETTNYKTSYTFTGLSASTTYYWKVRFKGASGSWSEYTSGQTRATSSVPASGTEYVLTSTGSQTWIAPGGGTYNIKVELWGAGGSGGGAGSGGGGGGYRYINSQSVVGGQSYSYTIGVGGQGVTWGVVGNNGGDTSMFSAIANGGRGALTSYDGGGAGGGGTGGSGGYSGGSGGVGASSVGYAGGGGAGSETGQGGVGGPAGDWSSNPPVAGGQGGSGGGQSCAGGGGAGYNGGGTNGGYGTGIDRVGGSSGTARSGAVMGVGGDGGGGGGGTNSSGPSGAGGRGLIILTAL